ncbi:hypothetical protein Dsin_021974 [Dipteronia sinensis]|uniref:Cytochrome P450 n=1 Tax=Dipteronia sinensis TaxID=43782 RepID=A0AAE0A0R0_9ROSI|nr:hypothetical protein Dsin_021974 [Dipteronia sinensis]
MEITSTTALFSGLGTIAIAWMLMRVVNWVWLKPKKLEKFLRQQGFSGNSYRLFHGDMKEITKQASTKAINISDFQVHNIVPRVLPFNHHINTIYGYVSKHLLELQRDDKFLPTALNRRMKSNYNETRALIKGIIHKKEEAIQLGEASNNDDLLGKLIESNNKEIQEHGKKETGMSIDEVIEECKCGLLEVIFIRVHLLSHVTVTKILQVALRLYSPASILTRTIYKETKLGEINIPPGILLSLPLVMVHHDHEYWGDDADEFNPDRFSEGVSKASNNNEVSFFPFGGVPRICIGQNFALMETKLVLAMILRNFSFELSPGYVHAPINGLTVQPQYGVIVSCNCFLLIMSKENM